MAQNEDMRTRFAAFPSLASLEATPRSLSGDVLLVDRRQDRQLGRLVHLAHNVLQATKTYSAQEAQLQRLAEVVRHALRQKLDVTIQGVGL